ncbi:MAG: ribonuclease protein component [Micromonosporaceae bacterium]|jgi:ribonuclease P protein component
MLAAAQRLRRRGEFAVTVRGGRRAGRGAVVVHLKLPQTNSGPSGVRAGFVVPKTVGGAVVRNRVKRQLRHLTRERLALLPAGSDVVVRALPGAARCPYPQMAVDLDGALASALARADRGGGRS